MYGAERLRRVLRRVTPRGATRGAILVYHRIADVAPDPQLLCVSPSHFAEHLAVLRRDWRPRALEPVVRSRGDANARNDAIAVTFDDGYDDNLHQAKPLLEKHDVPATVFVTTGYLDGQREYWWDELERVVLAPRALPRRFSLKLPDGKRLVHDLAADVNLAAGPARTRWNVLEPARQNGREQLYLSLHGALLRLSDGDRHRVLEEVGAWADTGRALRVTHRALAPNDVVELVEGGLIDVGAHTVTHSVLATLPLAMQRAEIFDSKVELERVVGRPVTSFAYPFGSSTDYSADTVQLVKAAGFTSACTSAPDLVRARSDPFRLPRHLVRNWDGETFSRFLRTWCGR
jgi:peptidoglycan/xylan/chitin deacetylase (PgdA/CDA1 family)